MSRTITRILTATALAISLSMAAEGGGHHHGEDIPLATKPMGQWQVTANRIGAWTPGKEGAGTVDLVPAKPAAKAVRVWIGDEEGRTATKTLGEPEATHPGGWHCHVAVPKTIPAGAQFWVVIETEGGERLKASFPLEPAATPVPAK